MGHSFRPCPVTSQQLIPMRLVAPSRSVWQRIAALQMLRRRFAGGDARDEGRITPGKMRRGALFAGGLVELLRQIAASRGKRAHGVEEGVAAVD